MARQLLAYVVNRGMKKTDENFQFRLNEREVLEQEGLKDLYRFDPELALVRVPEIHADDLVVRLGRDILWHALMELQGRPSHVKAQAAHIHGDELVKEERLHERLLQRIDEQAVLGDVGPLRAEGGRTF